MRDTYLGGSVTGNTHNLASMSLSLEFGSGKGGKPLIPIWTRVAQPYLSLL